VGSVGRGEAGACGPEATVRANRAWWDASAAAYQAEHGAFLGDTDFVWCPEGLREADARLLGDLRDVDVLEIGCGAAQCARWLRTEGARVVGIDLSAAQLAAARVLDARTGVRVPAVVADAAALPFGDGAFDVACSAYGALPFVADATAVLAEVRRVLRTGGRFVFSVSHPIRWCFPDDPGPAGLTVRDSYFDRRPYVEYDDSGALSYVEHHRTLGDWVQQIVAAGLRLDGLVEPSWPDGLDEVWGGWSPLRGRLMPGTAIFLTRR
jgi:SAM-dependent methyltransferase